MPTEGVASASRRNNSAWLARDTRVSVFGLGYVGTVTAACLAEEGFRTVGIDHQQIKVDLINDGRSPIVEPGLQDLIARNVGNGCLSASLDPEEAMLATDISLVCVGTPSRRNGDLSIDHLASVCREIGAALARKDASHTVVIRSTILPGTVRDLVRPVLEEASGKRAGRSFGLAYNPEFLREGTAIADFSNPPNTIIGAEEPETGEKVGRIYAHLPVRPIITGIEVAEFIKYANNSWHALKVAFANEIGNISKALGVDSHAVMNIFCSDTRLNISSSYLWPGFAFGGSCLPKDLRALIYRARTLDLEVPVLNSILPSNRVQIERAVQMIINKNVNRIGVLGFAFKAGTDDLRESPLVELIERLLGKGMDLRIFDRDVNVARLVGANRSYITQRIPHIAALMSDTVEEIVAHAELIVIGTHDSEFREVPSRLRSGQLILDLVRLPGWENRRDESYEGINW
jgi:GDP-mannose 6-dehydrogenase